LPHFSDSNYSKKARINHAITYAPGVVQLQTHYVRKFGINRKLQGIEFNYLQHDTKICSKL